MCNESQLKIRVVSNTPSGQALKNFQKKLYQLHQNNKLKSMSNSATNSGTAKKQ